MTTDKFIDPKDEKLTGETVQYSMKVSAHAVQVLSKSLYSYPHEAVVRELLCNALDSHMEAKTTRPVEVNTSGGFSIRDYGTGLAPNEVEKLYTTYFESSKVKEDGFIGSFGLGCKSPFAIVDEFTITGYWYGTATTWRAYLDHSGDGLPHITRVKIEDTEEPNGLFIAVPSTASAIFSACHKILRYIPTEMVNWNGNPASDFVENPEYEFNNGKIAITKLDYEQRRLYSQPEVIYNRVAYRLDIKKVKLPEEFNDIGFRVFMEPNTVDVHPSREHLLYNSKTVTNLTEATTNAIDEITNHYKAKYDGLSELEARKLFYEHMHNSPTYVRAITKKFSSSLPYKLLYGGRYPTEVTGVGYASKYIRNKYKVQPLPKDTTYAFNLHEIDSGKVNVALKTDVTYRVGRITEFLRDKRDTTLVVVETQEELNQFVKDLALPAKYIINLFDLPRPKTTRSPKGQRKASELYTLRGRGNQTTNSHNWDAVSDDKKTEILEEGGVYVPLKYGKPVAFEKVWDTKDLMPLLPQLDDDRPFVGVKFAELDLVKDDERWQSIEEYVKEKLEECREAFKDKQVAQDYSSYAWSSSRTDRWRQLAVTENPLILTFLAKLDEAEEFQKLRERYQFLASFYREEWMALLEATKTEETLESYTDELFRCYPMIKWTHAPYSEKEEMYNDLVNYVKTLDSLK